MSRRSRRSQSKQPRKAAELASTSPTAASTPVPGDRRFVRHLLRATGIMALLYATYYYPHRAGSLADGLINVYLRVQTWLAGVLIGAFDDSVSVTGTVLHGRFPLQIIKDCSSLDAQALLVGAILAFPAPRSRRLLGALLGALALNVVNLFRIASLYFIGVHARPYFDTAHEEILPLVLILTASLLFFGWTSWVRRSEDARGNV